MVRWVKVIALTALPAEKFGIIPCMSELRFSQLQKHGIDFSRLFTQEKIIIDTLNVDQYNNYPAFYKGIVFSGVNKKGKALEAFFDKIDFHPSKVLFFDDNLNNVKNVEKIMKACSVECYGYWYRAVDKLLHGKFNREIVEVQLTGLLEKDQYITVAEAEDRILQRNDFESEEVEEEEYD